MGEKNIQCIVLSLNDLAKLFTDKTKCSSSSNKMKGRNRLYRYSPYDIDARKRRKKGSRKLVATKFETKLVGIDKSATMLGGQCYSNFLFLDDMYTMATKQICEIARTGHGYKLFLSKSQESLTSDDAIGEQSRITLSKAPGTCWIKYS